MTHITVSLHVHVCSPCITLSEFEACVFNVSIHVQCTCRNWDSYHFGRVHVFACNWTLKCVVSMVTVIFTSYCALVCLISVMDVTILWLRVPKWFFKLTCLLVFKYYMYFIQHVGHPHAPPYLAAHRDPQPYYFSSPPYGASQPPIYAQGRLFFTKQCYFEAMDEIKTA